MPARIGDQTAWTCQYSAVFTDHYRTQKSILGPSSTDILFLYNSKEINDFQTIKEEVAEILKKVADERQL